MVDGMCDGERKALRLVPSPSWRNNKMIIPTKRKQSTQPSQHITCSGPDEKKTRVSNLRI